MSVRLPHGLPLKQTILQPTSRNAVPLTASQTQRTSFFLDQVQREWDSVFLLFPKTHLLWNACSLAPYRGLPSWTDLFPEMGDTHSPTFSASPPPNKTQSWNRCYFHQDMELPRHKVTSFKLQQLEWHDGRGAWFWFFETGSLRKLCRPSPRNSRGDFQFLEELLFHIQFEK